MKAVESSVEIFDDNLEGNFQYVRMESLRILGNEYMPALQHNRRFILP